MCKKNEGTKFQEISVTHTITPTDVGGHPITQAVSLRHFVAGRKTTVFPQ